MHDILEAPPNTAAQDVCEDLLSRVMGEFLEMPGLCLTDSQAQRLWGLAPPRCTAVLRTLVTSGFLRQRTDGRFVRRDLNSPVTDFVFFA